MGAQTLVSRSARPGRGAAAGAVAWGGQSSNFVLQRGGATLARVAVYRAGTLNGALGNKLVAWCTVDLASYFAEADEAEEEYGDAIEEQDNEEGGDAAAAAAELEAQAGGGGEEEEEEDCGPSVASAGGAGRPSPSREASQEEFGSEEVETWVDLTPADPTDPTPGRIRLSGQAARYPELERQLWRRLLPLADWSGDGRLELPEFSHLLKVRRGGRGRRDGRAGQGGGRRECREQEEQEHLGPLSGPKEEAAAGGGSLLTLSTSSQPAPDQPAPDQRHPLPPAVLWLGPLGGGGVGPLLRRRRRRQRVCRLRGAGGGAGAEPPAGAVLSADAALPRGWRGAHAGRGL